MKMDLEQLNKKYVGKTYVTKEDANSNKNQVIYPKKAWTWRYCLKFIFIFKQIFNVSDIRADCESFRVLAPNTPMTKDYREGRFNFSVTEEGVCDRVFMG